jgi:hypothetical protein
MSESRPAAPYGLIGLYGSLTAIGLGAFVVGVVLGNTTMMLVGGIGAFVAVAATPIAVACSRPAPGASAELGQLVRAIEELTERQALSDDARRVLSRKRERALLCSAIEEDIAAGDYGAASVLVKELAERFGYRAEAEAFRARVELARAETEDALVTELVQALDRLILSCNWPEAQAEAARIHRVFPDSPRTEGLERRVARARDRYKSELERRFLHLARDERIDEAFDVLKELDQYLTEAEAEPLKEVARGVVGKERENLGVQFRLALQDRDWTHAAVVGERIIHEFPNSRMADEARGMIDQIRERATAMPQPAG